MNGYRKIVIGSTERLPVRATDPTGAVVNLSTVDVTVRIADANGTLVVTDAVCVSGATQAYYDWDTTGLSAGRYSVQFDFDFGDGVNEIEPADPLTVLLADRLGGP